MKVEFVSEVTFKLLNSVTKQTKTVREFPKNNNFESD